MVTFGGEDFYHIPRKCKICGGFMIYEGIGEYSCEDCKAIDYDDYGKVRRYIETHRGANATEIEAATGVTRRTIRKMLEDSRIQIAKGTTVALRCEICGQTIRSGRLCERCERRSHRRLLDE